MFCPKCGKDLPDGAQFCAHCGKAVSEKTQQWKKQELTEVSILNQEGEHAYQGPAGNVQQQGPIISQKRNARVRKLSSVLP